MKEIKGFSNYHANKYFEVFRKEYSREKEGRVFSYRAKKVTPQKLPNSTDIWYHLIPDGKSTYTMISKTKVKFLCNG